MDTPLYAGGTYVKTQGGVPLSVQETMGNMILPNGTRVQVKRAWVDAVSNATTELSPANPLFVYRVLTLFMLGGGTAPTVTLKSNTTAISPTLANAANGGAVLPPNLWGWFQTLAMNDALNVTVSSSSTVGIIVNYIEITDDLVDLL